MKAAALLLVCAIAAFAYLVVATLILFGSVCRLQQLRDAGRLTPALKLVGYGLVLPIGYLHDFSLNLAASVLFLRLPQDWLLTGRLIRYKREGVGWRSRLAVLVCSQLLDPLDPSGCHCRT